MITAIVRYKLPASIDRDACLAHFTRIAPGFRAAGGLISKHFIWSKLGNAGGVYQWETLADAEAFYSGPWLKGVVERYGMQPEIEFYEVFAITDNAAGTVKVHGVARERAVPACAAQARSGPGPGPQEFLDVGQAVLPELHALADEEGLGAEQSAAHRLIGARRSAI